MEFVLLRSRGQVAALSIPAAALIHEVIDNPDATYTPEYFLPRLQRTAEPRVVTGYEDGRLACILYAYEITIWGLPTGFVFGGDQMGRGLLVCDPDRESEMLTGCCNFLLQNGIHAMRFDWTPRRPKGAYNLQEKRPSVRVKTVADPRTEGDWLQLQPDYDAFLAHLGPHTRRNLRYYRRKAEAAGLSYSGLVGPGESQQALRFVNRLADYPMEPVRLARDKRYMAAFGTPIIAGLRTPAGEFVSLVTGFTSGSHLHILTQLNGEDPEWRKLSLSLVLRGYLIEEFIHRGFTAVHFFQGSSPMLGRFCAPVDLQHLSIDDASMVMTPFKQACSALATRLHRQGRRVPWRLQWAAGSYWA